MLKILVAGLLSYLVRVWGVFEWYLILPFFKMRMRNFFREKSVAVVGSAPDLIGAKMGTKIDEHDIVVRVNYPRNSHDLISFGKQTDFVFLGANIKDQKYISSLSKKIPPKCKIISTTKNKANIRNIRNIRSHFKHIFYPKILPNMLTRKIVQEIGFSEWSFKIDRPPRSGLICIGSVLKYGKPKKITIFGMSCASDAARKTINAFGKVVVYDEKSLLRFHCDPAVEIKILNKMVEFYKGKLDWRKS